MYLFIMKHQWKAIDRGYPRWRLDWRYLAGWMNQHVNRFRRRALHSHCTITIALLPALMSHIFEFQYSSFRIIAAMPGNVLSAGQKAGRWHARARLKPYTELVTVDNNRTTHSSHHVRLRDGDGLRGS
jgi:hypothetical protein